ncbi:MAG: hypothetical protein WBN96_00010 [Gammaproteobacteria bacterium]
MLTEVDIERIMGEKRRLFETIAEQEGYNRDNEDVYDMMEVECPVCDTNGLM